MTALCKGSACRWTYSFLQDPNPISHGTKKSRVGALPLLRSRPPICLIVVSTLRLHTRAIYIVSYTIDNFHKTLLGRMIKLRYECTLSSKISELWGDPLQILPLQILPLESKFFPSAQCSRHPLHDLSRRQMLPSESLHQRYQRRRVGCIGLATANIAISAQVL